MKRFKQTDTNLKVTGEIRPMSAYAVTLCRWNRVPSKRSNRIMSWLKLKLRPLFPTKGMSWKHTRGRFLWANLACFHTHWCLLSKFLLLKWFDVPCCVALLLTHHEEHPGRYEHDDCRSTGIKLQLRRAETTPVSGHNNKYVAASHDINPRV